MSDIVKRNNVEAILVAEVNMYKIKLNGSSYRVDIQPDISDPSIKSKSFPFTKGDHESKSQALKEALIYRDNKILISYRTNTGYNNIKIIKNSNNVIVHFDKTIKGIPYNDTKVIGKNMSYKEALTQLLKYHCDLLKITLPEFINFDFGQYIAMELGYTPHDDEPKIVSKQYKCGDSILDTKTNTLGIIRHIIDDVNIVAEFETGRRFRTITNDELAINMLDSKINSIEKLATSLDSDTLSNEQKEITNKIISNLEKDVVKTASQSTDNGITDTSIKSLKKVVVRKRITVTKRRKVTM